MPVIDSLLDTDLYKLTMQQAAYRQRQNAPVEYEFRCRNANELAKIPLRELEEEIDALCALKFQPQELEFLSKLRYVKPDYIEYLENFRLPRKAVEIAINGKDNQLLIKIKGSWLSTILFEVPILAIVNEVWFRQLFNYPKDFLGNINYNAKVKAAKDYLAELPSGAQPFLITDFGTRRRRSRHWHKYVISRLVEDLPGCFVGTSNAWLAKELNITAFGTMAHEWYQFFQPMVKLCDFQRYALQIWANEYRGDLGIALSDIMGMDAFLRDFDLYFCKLFDGCRHDSGDPFEWTEKLIAHYKANRIEPMTKRAVYSDGLTIPKAIELHKKFRDKIQLGFGIGTNLTNDVGIEPLNIVIKMTRCDGKPVAKVSDARGKTICEDAGFLAYLKSQFGIKE